MTTRGQINSNFYQIVDVDSNGNPTQVKPEYVPSSNTANANYANFAGTVVNSAQPNITSTGNLVSLNVVGNIDTSGVFNGNGSGLSNLAVSNITGLGNIATTNYDGNAIHVLYGNGAWANIPTVSNVANANFANFANYANFSNHSNYSNVANVANSVSVSNVSGIGNIATINLDGNVSNLLAGNGTWIPVPNTASSNFANFAGNVTIASQPNITSVGSLSNLQFNNTVTPITAAVGQMFWDTGEHTITLGMENGVQQQIGLEQYMYVKASSAITNGQAVMFTGANGDNILAAPCDTTSVGFKTEYYIGIATQSIATNGFGFITTFGLVHGLNTSSYNVGDILWVNNSVPGGLTNVQPSDPNFQIQVAAVTKKAGGDGHIMVRATVFQSLTRLSDVNITSATSGQALVLDGSNTWINGIPNIANIAYSVSGSNVTGQVNYAAVANSVAVANVSGIGNIATINLTGSTSNVLYGNGVFAPPTGGVANANYANFAGNVINSVQSNITSLGTLTSLSVQPPGVLTSANTINFIQNYGCTAAGGTVFKVDLDGVGVPGSILADFQANSVSKTKIDSNGNVTASYFIGNGSALTGVVANTANTANTVINNAQPNITSVGTLSSVTVSGNINGNVYYANNVFISNVTTGTAPFTINSTTTVTNLAADTSNTASYAVRVTGNAQPNITSLGTLSSLTVTSNITSGNANLGNLVTANFFSGNGSLLTSIPSGNISGQVANALVAGTVYTNAQPNITSLGTLASTTLAANANLTLSGSLSQITGANLVSATYHTGTLTTAAQPNITSVGTLSGLTVTATITGNINGSAATATSATTAGTVTTAAQPNITSLGTLTSLSVTGNISSGNANLGNLVTANFFSGNGSSLTGITATTAVTVTGNAQPNITSVGTLASLNVTGNIQSNSKALIGLTSTTLTNPVAVFSGSGATYDQVAIINSTGTGSADYVTYGNNGDDTQSWTDIGFTGNTFSDANYTVTAAGDGYLFVQGNSSFGGNLVIATGNTGTTKDIVFATGGFLTGNIKARLYNGNGAFSVTGNIVGGNINTAGTANIGNVILKTYEETVVNGGNTSTAITPDVASGTIFKYTANANFTLNSLTNVAAGTSATIIITQDGTGNRLMTSTMKFAGGSKTLSTTASAIDIVCVFYDGTTYYATLSKGYA